MNIEESHRAQGIRAAGPHLGHVHFVDSNPCPAGGGHIDIGPIADVPGEIQYADLVSAAAFHWSDPDAAARQAIESFRRLFR